MKLKWFKEKYVVFALFTAPKHRFSRLIYNVGIESRDKDRSSKLLDWNLVGMFSRLKTQILIFLSYIKFILLIINDNIFITKIHLNKLVFFRRCKS